MFKHLLLGFAVAAVTVAPATAQIAPGDTGAGIQRGLTAVNSSAQTGFVTVFSRGNPRIQVVVDGSRGKPESVTLVRGRDCPLALAATSNVAVLGMLHNGRLTAPSPLPFDRLLSGNYTVLVRNNTPDSRAVSCGHLYLS
jgi:hypothetical protein